MNNQVDKYKELLANVDNMSIDEIVKTTEEINPAVKYMKTQNNKAKEIANKTESIKTSTNKNFKGITSLRYGAMNLYSELGINHDQEYTKEQLINILQKYGYFEFNDKNTEFIQYEKDGTIVITIKGNSKGLEFKKITGPLLKEIETRFKEVYHKNKTEARVLVYCSSMDSGVLIKFPEQKNTEVSTTSDIQFNITENGIDYYLLYDFHSHHEMGAFFSPIDDANEKFRNIIYGVFSWNGNTDVWKFRIFDGTKFIDLRDWEVVKL